MQNYLLEEVVTVDSSSSSGTEYPDTLRFKVMLNQSTCCERGDLKKFLLGGLASI